MSIKENKTLIRRVYELWNRKELDKYLEVFAPGYVEHYPDGDMPLKQVIESGTMFCVAFPDVTSTIEDMVAEGDKVAVLMTSRGTHKGEFLGIPPTGNKIEMRNTCIIRIANGKLAEWWGTLDGLSVMQQLGVIPK